MLLEIPGGGQAHHSGAEDGDLLGLKRPGARDVGVPVIPGHEVRGTVGAVEVDTRDAQGCVLDATRREHNRVVVLAHDIQGKVRAVVNVREKADVTTLEHLVQGVNDHLDAGVVWCDAVADQSEGCGETLDEVNAHVDLGFGQDVRGVDTGGACANDRYPQRAVGTHGISGLPGQLLSRQVYAL